jgi:hypothetical protein
MNRGLRWSLGKIIPMCFVFYFIYCFYNSNLIFYETLLPLLKQWIEPGSHVITDGWQAYNGLACLDGGGYVHDTIIHEENFVNPFNPDLHTQNIESLWYKLKTTRKRQTPSMSNNVAQLFA